MRRIVFYVFFPLLVFLAVGCSPVHIPLTAEHAAKSGQQDALGEQLARDADALGPERKAQSDLLVACRRASQQEIADVGDHQKQQEQPDDSQ